MSNVPEQHWVTGIVIVYITIIMIKTEVLVFVVGLTFCHGFDQRYSVVMSDITKESVVEVTEIESGVLPDWLDGRLYKLIHIILHYGS